jgi:hypothetical protein
MRYTARRGFYLILPPPDSAEALSSSGSSGAAAGGLPPGTLRLDAGRGRGGVPCTTHELTALNTRLRDAADDCLALTEQVAHGPCTVACLAPRLGDMRVAICTVLG